MKWLNQKLSIKIKIDMAESTCLLIFLNFKIYWLFFFASNIEKFHFFKHVIITFIYMYVLFKFERKAKILTIEYKRNYKLFNTNLFRNFIKKWGVFFSQIIFYEHILKPKYLIINSNLLRKSCIIVNLYENFI